MDKDLILNISNISLYSAFILYLVAVVPFSFSVRSSKKRAEKIGVTLTIVGFVLQIIYFITRWIAAGHAPVSNMYEFLTMFGIMMVGGFLVIYSIYKTPVLALFVLPIAMLLIAYASMFSRDVSPLIPALQSSWLAIHVITVTISYGILSISCVAGLIYLLAAVSPKEKSIHSFFVEVIMYFVVIVIGFILTTVVMKDIAGYDDTYFFIDKNDSNSVQHYHLPAFVTQQDSLLVDHVSGSDYEPKERTDILKWSKIELPAVINAQKLNTVIWSIVIGTILYGILRLIFKGRTLFSLIKPLTKRVNLSLMDEIGYRSVIIGFPLFALGGILFASIWAQMAWSRYWGWDPKEVWALITFLYYAIFLHLRLGKGWEGRKSAWLAVGGLAIILFNVIAVNLIVAGLHSYA
ncbi:MULTISPECIES: c-type cytochrome biogenesis protein CcsB [Mammaliicoccus]|uniref:C-type cytochrome biogenesis protein CcsB n=1 Tax=Mammaliicoccus lentus TaxID=42858 RepID=A0AAX3W846_MAMLE|nr:MULTISPECIES: c-type cytochrome biogenesis protein CcsB [Mammaliicoccus]HBV03986.1 c-type cytochrome biogenesis protein CcsB [Staphylococcus sp.]MBF0747850.1 c-type cytochrome biogenesis protein CcsB [Mammaliicoccus lentus]MBF0793202.1 c-type cytochrome biogenesis protein CcsB [Mammaliicoccus lentus]MBU6113955.1 c-type cytochrome biogenesis protein CcsB [Mammaliicoccus lentus]MBW0761560.1 c-type cytochrome biogenesis protein CcsB [Mammaliicoccus lentus]